MLHALKINLMKYKFFLKKYRSRNSITILSSVFAFKFQKKLFSIFSLIFLVFCAQAVYAVDLSNYLNTATVVSSDDQFEEETGNNSSSVTVYPKAQLNIVKVVVNDNGGIGTIESFTITAANQSPSFGVASGVGDSKTYTAEALHLSVDTSTLSSQFNLAELEVDGYDIEGWSCAGDGTPSVTSGQRTGTITLGIAEAATCTITNNDISPRITLVKVVINDNGGDATVDDFDLSLAGNSFVSASTESVTGGVRYISEAIEVDANTDLSLTEASITGYDNGTWSCDNGTLSDSSSGGGVINISSGVNATCTITNNDVAPEVTLIKIVKNDNGGNATVSDFQLKVDNTEFVTAETSSVTGGISYTSEVIKVSANQAFSLTEQDVAGYETGTWACTNGSLTAGAAGTGSITLTEGQNTTCTITNDDKGVDLGITKTVSNLTPEIGEEITFTLVVGNTGDHTATDVEVTDTLPAGFTYVVNSSAVTGGTASTSINGNALGWTIDDIDSGNSVTITFRAKVKAP